MSFVIRYVPDQYKTQQVCDKALPKNGGKLESVPDCYQNQEICDEAVDNYPHTLKVVPDCYKIQEICDKLSILIFPQYNLFLNTRHKKCVMKLLIDFCLYFLLFLIGVKLK